MNPSNSPLGSDRRRSLMHSNLSDWDIQQQAARTSRSGIRSTQEAPPNQSSAPPINLNLTPMQAALLPQHLQAQHHIGWNRSGGQGMLPTSEAVALQHIERLLSLQSMEDQRHAAMTSMEERIRLQNALLTSGSSMRAAVGSQTIEEAIRLREMQQRHQQQSSQFQQLSSQDRLFGQSMSQEGPNLLLRERLSRGLDPSWPGLINRDLYQIQRQLELKGKKRPVEKDEGKSSLYEEREMKKQKGERLSISAVGNSFALPPIRLEHESETAVQVFDPSKSKLTSFRIFWEKIDDRKGAVGSSGPDQKTSAIRETVQSEVFRRKFHIGSICTSKMKRGLYFEKSRESTIRSVRSGQSASPRRSKG